VFEKDGLEQQLLDLGNSTTRPVWQGIKKCKKCGREHPAADVYAGKHDVPDKYRAKLAERYGDRIDLPDDLLADKPKEDLGYQVQERPSIFDTAEVPPDNTPLSIPFSDIGDGYAVAATQAPQHAPSKLQEVEQEAVSLTPGEKVPKTGKYRCTSCGKGRLSSKSAPAKPSEPKQVVVKSFKAGKTFGECPNCGDLTEWELVPE
jgi:hypothetical protein